MGLFLNRKMIKIGSIINATVERCSSICEKDEDLKFVDCSTCFVFCPEKCQAKYYENYELPSPPTHLHHKTTPSTFLTVSMVLLAASFVLVLAYTLYLRKRRRNNIPSTTTTDPNPNDPQQQQEGDFLDHGGPTVEHHIWYIRTVGLDPAAISSITALKYRKDEGLVEGTDCSVCLSEFQEDEALRLLPKCSHAFHVACIDTWLRSHTNCPMCRAPVLAGPVKLPSSADQSSSSSHESEETRIEILSGDVEESEVAENPNESLRVEPSRRSVSLDCLGSKELEVIKELRNLNSGKRIEKKLERLRSGGSSNNGQNVSSSSSASAMKRSKSCQGKFVLCRPIRVTDSILPLRSV